MSNQTTDDVFAAARAVERIVNEHTGAGHSCEGLALTMMAAAADLLTRQWGAPRTLAAFDQIVEIACEDGCGMTAH